MYKKTYTLKVRGMEKHGQTCQELEIIRRAEILPTLPVVTHLSSSTFLSYCDCVYHRLNYTPQEGKVIWLALSPQGGWSVLEGLNSLPRHIALHTYSSCIVPFFRYSGNNYLFLYAFHDCAALERTLLLIDGTGIHCLALPEASVCPTVI